MSRFARAAHTFAEVAGHCTKCGDLFTVELAPLEKRSPTTRYYRPVTGPHLSYKQHTLYHKPKRCGGAVKLFGIPRIATFDKHHDHASR